ncbi:MAG: plasmid partitioning protein RepB [Rhizobiaceae bacterium]|nr:plasmid partitioning protein RepB [Rhizobiaceae bacterium]
MARKGLLDSVIAPDETRSETTQRADYARRGASRAMMLSLDELAQNSNRLLEGEAIVSLDPALIDASPVADRIQDEEGEDEEYQALVEAIRADGQASPVLVRPHPSTPDRYMIVFGRRRLKAAKELGLQVRAIVKPLEDVAAIIAQGQENSARADLSFIERALFARKLVDLGQTKETVKSALTVDNTLLSRMLSIADGIPAAVLEALGASKGVGRDRWEELKRLVQRPSNAEAAIRYVRSDEFFNAHPADRFNRLLETLAQKPARKPSKKASVWVSPDSVVAATVGVKRNSVSIALSSSDDIGFGIWLSKSLNELYRTYERSRNAQNGD